MCLAVNANAYFARVPVNCQRVTGDMQRGFANVFPALSLEEEAFPLGGEEEAQPTAAKIPHLRVTGLPSPVLLFLRKMSLIEKRELRVDENRIFVFGQKGGGVKVIAFPDRQKVARDVLHEVTRGFDEVGIGHRE